MIDEDPSSSEDGIELTPSSLDEDDEMVPYSSAIPSRSDDEDDNTGKMCTLCLNGFPPLFFDMVIGHLDNDEPLTCELLEEQLAETPKSDPLCSDSRSEFSSICGCSYWQ